MIFPFQFLSRRQPSAHSSIFPCYSPPPPHHPAAMATTQRPAIHVNPSFFASKTAFVEFLAPRTVVASTQASVTDVASRASTSSCGCQDCSRPVFDVRSGSWIHRARQQQSEHAQ